jgi:hypothetical protein
MCKSSVDGRRAARARMLCGVYRLRQLPLDPFSTLPSYFFLIIIQFLTLVFKKSGALMCFTHCYLLHIIPCNFDSSINGGAYVGSDLDTYNTMLFAKLALILYIRLASKPFSPPTKNVEDDSLLDLFFRTVPRPLGGKITFRHPGATKTTMRALSFGGGLAWWWPSDRQYVARVRNLPSIQAKLLSSFVSSLR